MDSEIFKNIIKNTYNFDDKEEKCELCGNDIQEFCDNGIYEGKYCEECFNEAEESRM